ncbi:MAG: PVC-type heme-binding CxxCH protein [Pirellulales bacterium]
MRLLYWGIGWRQESAAVGALIREVGATSVARDYTVATVRLIPHRLQPGTESAMEPASPLPPYTLRTMLAAAILTTALLPAAARSADAVPQVLDKRLQLALIAAEPDLVTPVGIAADTRGSLYVVENHTHFRPEDYDGPAGDRIVVFTSTTGDARQVPRVFYTGLRYAMQLAIHPSEPWLYVATRSEVLRLRDTNGDQVADERQTLLKLETAGDYPHNGLSGMLFDATGNLWVGMGENLGAKYRLVGSDGTSLEGGGEGGNLFWCRADGSQMRNYATGFWNPFALASDPAGRLFAVDNDPDSRPPCRLLHVVEHGDYGFRFRNGRRGVYPFTAWNGEIPGTLPMVAGTGEAPSGLVWYSADNWPADYRGTLLGGSWGSHRIEQFRLSPRGASWQGERVSVVQGDERFRPVGLAVAPDGALWFTDWVDKSYPLHKQGRLWRLSAQHSSPAPQPTATTRPTADPLAAMRAQIARREWTGAEQLTGNAAVSGDGAKSGDAWHALLSAAEYSPQQLTWEKLPASEELRSIWLRRWPARVPQAAIVERLGSTDPFVRQAARVGLERLADAEYAAIVNDPRVALLPDTILARRNRHERPDAATFGQWLDADDRQTRFVALQWIAESVRTDCRELVDSALRGRCDTRELFAAALATLERLDHPEDDVDEERSWVEYAAPLLSDAKLEPSLLVRVLRILPADHPALTAERWNELWSHPDAGVRVDAVRSWRLRSGPDVVKRLLELAADTDQPSAVRAEAIASLDPDDQAQRDALNRLAADQSEEVSAESRRTLRLAGPHGSTDATAAKRRQRIDTIAGVTGGNRQLGERLFFHPRVASCYRCHQWQGRGAELGPSLSAIGQSSDRRRLVESLLDPSREIAPQYVPWSIELEDGRVLTGMLIGEDDQNRATYVDSQGKTFTLAPSEVAARRSLATSIMPEGLADQLTDDELGSLVEFLRGER